MIYATWADQMLNLPDDMAGKYIKAVLDYAIYGHDTESDNTFINAMLVPVRKKLDEDLNKYQAKVDRAKTISKRNHNEIDTISERNQNDIGSVTDTVTDTDTVTVTDKDKKKNTKKKSTFYNFPERSIDYEELKNV